MTAVRALRARSTLPVDDWLAALDGLFTIPAGYRQEDVDRTGALDILRCSDEVLTELVNAGLPHTGELFDRHDLFNLALYSKSGTSAAELGIRFALRWMTHDPRTWFQPMRWTYSLTMTGPQSGSGPATFAVARPLPEVFGGRVERIEARAGEVARTSGSTGPDVEVVTEGDTAQVDAVLRTIGEPRTLRSSRLREIVSEYSHGDHRWARMPEELQRHPELVLPHGVAPCISVSLDLAEKARAAGYPARTRRGWILGMLDLAHSWLEVTDDDGMVKVVDPIFAGLADHADGAHPDFRAACFGSALNRLLPTAHEADEGLYEHRRGGVTAVPKSTLTIRAAKEHNEMTRKPL